MYRALLPDTPQRAELKEAARIPLLYIGPDDLIHSSEMAQFWLRYFISHPAVDIS
jgi:hypothetical protein